jgi:cyclopropane fatty-acyl-phospholipid synthase-like methyltransferase
MADLKEAGSQWDHYVTHTKQTKDYLPGDEWGEEKRWDMLFKSLLAPAGDSEPVRHFAEIGQGSGKYTKRALSHFDSDVAVCCDVSKEFLRLAEEQLSMEFDCKEIHYEELEQVPLGLYNSVSKYVNPGELDLLFSMDAMVHVELSVIFTYLVNANYLLREGGTVAMTTANGASSQAMGKIIKDIPAYFRTGGAFCGRFFFMSHDILLSLLQHSGFTLEWCEHNDVQRDIWWSAKKTHNPAKDFFDEWR